MAEIPAASERLSATECAHSKSNSTTNPSFVCSCKICDGIENLTNKDREILAMKDENYVPHSWDNMKQIIDDHQLQLLTRSPSAIRKYHERKRAMIADYGSVTNFILTRRLFWELAAPEQRSPGSLLQVSNKTPLLDPEDYRIIVNDHPYGMEEGINHLIVWLKHRLPATQETGLTPESHALVDKFVESNFRSKLGADNVMWFRNWAGIQSVRDLEHFHVLVRNVSMPITELLH